MIMWNIDRFIRNHLNYMDVCPTILIKFLFYRVSWCKIGSTNRLLFYDIVLSARSRLPRGIWNVKLSPVLRTSNRAHYAYLHLGGFMQIFSQSFPNALGTELKLFDGLCLLYACCSRLTAFALLLIISRTSKLYFDKQRLNTNVENIVTRK